MASAVRKIVPGLGERTKVGRVQCHSVSSISGGKLDKHTSERKIYGTMGTTVVRHVVLFMNKHR